MIIIKFGGSVITDKSKTCTYNNILTKQLLDELANFYDNLNLNRAHKTTGSICRDLNNEFKIVIVHGAGSFGHIKAKEYRLNEGYQEDSQYLGVSEVSRDVRELNLLFINDILSYCFPVISIPPYTVIKNDNKTISHFEFESFTNTLDMNNIPVTFGDVVVDNSLKFSICSGDSIIQHLAQEFNPTHVIFITNVDGLCTNNPVNEDAELISHLTENTFRSAFTDQNINPDVTGGIFLKGKIALTLAKNGIKSYIINGTKPGRFTSALLGEEVEGTIVE
jgi:isopentenyl phosphate kinase